MRFALLFGGQYLDESFGLQVPDGFPDGRNALRGELRERPESHRDHQPAAVELAAPGAALDERTPHVARRVAAGPMAPFRRAHECHPVPLAPSPPQAGDKRTELLIPREAGLEYKVKVVGPRQRL